ncbi:PqqD family protein [Pendulispora albinea]|uniref:PqqD family protein n=1 Tax=Pendulispora albinea TaxID=2741071 RepID=A0ABZ2M2H1_9BACT
MGIDADGRVLIAQNVHVREFDGELVILDLAKGDYFGINEIGARLWRGLEMGKSCAELARDLATEYDADPGLLLADLVALTDDFIAKGLVVPRASTG